MKYFSSNSPKDISLNLLDSALVEANRRGEVTPEQAAWLKSAPWGGVGRLRRVVIGVIIGLGALLFIFFAFSTNLNSGVIFVVGFLVLILLAVILGPRLMKALRDSTRLQEDLQSVLVRQVPGELVYEKGSYMVKAGEQILALPASTNSCGLLPGLRYICYYLESSSILLSAEQLGVGSPGMVRQSLNTILAAAHSFKMDDLDTNRNGGISSAQRNALVRQIFSSGAGAITGLIFFAAILWPFFLQGKPPEDFTSLIIPLVMALWILIPAGLAIYRGLADILGGAVEVAQGAALKTTEKRSSGRSSRLVYLYNINDVKLQVPQSAYLALIDGLEYRAYFAPRTRKLLSMETVDVPLTSPLGA